MIRGDANMIPYERKEKIAELIKQKELIYIEELMEMLPEVSESTIRRDLQSLAKEGRIVLLRGGAAKIKVGAEFDLPLETKLVINMEAKERIARYAAALVNDGEVIYLDSSTTVLPMIKYLSDKQITIVTSSTNIPNMISNPKIKCIVLGGEVMTDFGSIVGTITENLLATMFFDKAFMGANGFSILGGVSSPHLTEGSKMKIAYRNSKKTFMLMDTTKANITALCKVFELKECDVVTDIYSEILENFKSYIVVPEDE